MKAAAALALAYVGSVVVAVAPWALDSGGFTELSMTGAWSTTPEQYVAEARRYAEEIGSLAWVAPQDWMCEPFVLAKTGRTVSEHQRATVDNFLHLRDLAPELPWLPVLQGWERDDYWRCWGLYGAAGVDLAAAGLVGIGTVCRRQSTGEVGAIIAGLALAGLRLHGWALASADSMAWSFDGRRTGNRCGGTHKTCANCLTFALSWREALLRRLAHQQLQLRLVA